MVHKDISICEILTDYLHSLEISRPPSTRMITTQNPIYDIVETSRPLECGLGRLTKLCYLEVSSFDYS